VTEVRELLESTASALPAETRDVPLRAVLAAGRRRVRRRRLAVGAAGAAAAAVLLTALPISAGGGTSPAGVDGLTGGSGRVPVGDTTCGDVTFDKAELPGRRVTVDNGDWPTGQAADLLALHGWPRAVPYAAAHWTVVTNGDAAVLVASLPGAPRRYLPIHKAAGGGWLVGPPCTPH
jgi:hypothetical protein